ncbi:MAG: hypothetical protein LH478_01450 [Chitinophagaceae bacterium]|nr:hypothetical protein [Chitinophagaceae bacterium]
MGITIAERYKFTKKVAAAKQIKDFYMETNKKEIQFYNETFLKDIQKLFNTYYPFLKIEFWEEKRYPAEETKVRNDHYGMQVKDVSNVKEPVAIDVSGERTIEEMVKDFKTNSGTNINVYRKSGNVWNVITLTESWTLESQNKAGQFISSEMKLTV